MMTHDVIAVYPGTFDPMTLGHEDVVRRATQLFGHLIVAVAAGHHKKAMFSLNERIDMVREAVKDYPQVRVESFSGLLRDFVVSRGGKAMVRGLRAVTDFDYEFQLAGMNRSLMPPVDGGHEPAAWHRAPVPIRGCACRARPRTRACEPQKGIHHPCRHAHQDERLFDTIHAAQAYPGSLAH